MKKKVLLAISIIIIGISILLPITIFEVKYDDHRIYYKHINQSVQMILTHEHSVSKDIIQDLYNINADSIVLKESTFQYHGGAGMPDVEAISVKRDEDGIHYNLNENFNQHIAFTTYPMHTWQLMIDDILFDYSNEKSVGIVEVSISKDPLLVYVFKSLSIFQEDK